MIFGTAGTSRFRFGFAITSTCASCSPPRAANGLANLNTAAILGYFLAFGLMGLWHGIELHYIVYGLYQATLLSGFHIFPDWNKTRHYWRDGFLSNALAIFITFHFRLLRFAHFFGTHRCCAVAALFG